jgi:GNAT superfamily N-acetyltransferase
MPQLQRYADTTFPADLRWQAVAFMRIVWPWIDGGLIATPYPADWLPHHFAIVEGRLLLSYAATIRRTIRHAGVEYRVAGLGNVLTYPGSRRQGHGGRVVQAATEAIDASDADIGLLFCARTLLPFYARCGWVPVVPETRGPPVATDASAAPAMALLRPLSARGHRGREDFATVPLDIAEQW